jgi:penicillin-binding protein 2
LAVLLNLGIGQGELLVTPLQLAQFFCGLANNGRVYRPHLVKTIVGVDGRESETEGEVSFVLPFSESTLRVLKAGLIAVVQGGAGTARGARINGVTIGGKTGTAQVARGYTSKRPDEADIPYKYRDHAWFFGISPVDTPEIVVVALLEHAGHGGSVCAPIVKDVIKGYYLRKEVSREQIRKTN